LTPRRQARSFQFFIRSFRHLRQMTQKSPFERLVFADWDRKPNDSAEPPAAPFDQARKFAAGDWSYGNFQDPFFTVVFWLGYLHRQAPFDRLSDIAEEFFHRFAFRSAAGIAGTSAQKPPSSASCTTILIFMFVSVRAK
jgi:hypothetical protein